MYNYVSILYLSCITIVINAKILQFKNVQSSNRNCLGIITKKLHANKYASLYIHDGLIRDEYVAEQINIIWNLMKRDDDGEILWTRNVNFNHRTYVVIVSSKNLPYAFDRLRNSKFWHKILTRYAIFIIILINDRQMIDIKDERDDDTLRTYVANYFFALNIFKLIIIDPFDQDCTTYSYDPVNNVNKLKRLNDVNRLTYRTVFNYLYDMKNITALTHIFPTFISPPYLSMKGGQPVGLILNPLNLWMKQYNVTVKYSTTKDEQMKDGISYLNVFEHIEKINEIIAVYPTRLYQEINETATRSLFSHSYVWVIPKAKKLSNTTVLTLTFTKNVWIYIVVTVLVYTIFWYFINKYNKQYEDIKIDSAFLDTLRLTLCSGVPRPPYSNVSRLCLVSFLMFSFNVNNIFQGKYSSFLTVPQYEDKIDDEEKLALSNLQPVVLTFYKKLIMSWNNKYAPLLLKKSIFSDKAIIRNLNLYKNMSIAYACLEYGYEPSVKLENDMFPSKIHYALEPRYLITSGSPFFESLDNITEIIVEGGFIKKWLTDYIGVAFIEETQETLILSLEHVECSFLILGCGLSISLFVFAVEFFTFFLRENLKQTN